MASSSAVERLTVNQVVAGSIPALPAKLRGVAQPGRVRVLDTRCRRFESCRPDQSCEPHTNGLGVTACWNCGVELGR